MAPLVLDIESPEMQRDSVHQAVQAIAEGQVVAFPTETVYGIGASALNEDAVNRLFEIKGRPENQPMTLAIKGYEAALDLAPAMCPLSRRLARRTWPGPLTLVLDASNSDSAVFQLPEFVQQRVISNGRVGMRVPQNNTLLDVLELSTGPLVLTSANRSGEADTVTAEEVIEQLGDDVDLVLNGGPCQLNTPSTVASIDNDGINILRQGALSPEDLRQLGSVMITLVCTGNTCRSPMAEILLKKLLAEHLDCELNELQSRGIMVESAGVAAMNGSPASAESIQSMTEVGLDLKDHASQQLTPLLARDADWILTMTNSHRDAIIQTWPQWINKTTVLAPSGHDISDPIGGPLEVYEACAEQIKQFLEGRMPEFETLISSIPGQ